MPAEHSTASMIPLISSSPLAIKPRQLTNLEFLPFGHVIESPLSYGVNSMPEEVPRTAPAFTCANQGTALKASPVFPWVDTYDESLSHTAHKPTISMFTCFPRELTQDKEHRSLVFPVHILERHPFTTQTFTPMGLSHDDQSTKYLVIVAPSKQPREAFPRQGPPDIANVRAFIACGRQAVTYGAGVWHAPMVVLGEKRIDFVVVQSTNGVPEDDCQEVAIESGTLAITLDNILTNASRDAKL